MRCSNNIQLVDLISASVFDSLCTIGFHSTFLNKAINVIGMYVIINIGNVNVYKTFLDGVVYIFFLSDTVVIAPIVYKVTYMLQNPPRSDSSTGSTLTPAISPTSIAEIFKIALNTVSTMAGMIDIDIS